MTDKCLKHPVIFCGAGPGDPELITVKGMNALRAADLVIYAGSLVPEAVLVWCREDAIRISSADMHLDDMVNRMVGSFRNGKQVVRLHTGDPSLYGAIFEQMVALDAHGVPYRVIPGVTAAFAAAASMGLEFTIPDVTQTVILTRMAGRTPVPEEEALEKLARHGSSMVIYLSMALIDRVAAILKKTYGPDAHCAVAYKVSHPEEQVIYTRVADLKSVVKKAAIDRHAVIVISPALAIDKKMSDHRSKLYDKAFLHAHRQS